MKENNNVQTIKEDHDASRRQFMKNAGKILAWVPPALVVISSNHQAFAAQSWNKGGGIDGPGDGNGGPDPYKPTP